MKSVQVEIWQEYWGLLQTDAQSGASLYGFENSSSGNHIKSTFQLQEGSVFGYVISGALSLGTAPGWTIRERMWFSIANVTSFQLHPNSSVMIVQTPYFHTINMMAGPLEPVGRLRYIDGCSDTLLCPPPRKGDPCLNHLHFPVEIHQTAHHHPSVRFGCVADAENAVCVSESTARPLTQGSIFSIPPICRHAFHTSKAVMNVIAFHPETDCGPEDDNHPMINRTIIG